MRPLKSAYVAISLRERERERERSDDEEMVVSEDEETANNFYLQDSFNTPV